MARRRPTSNARRTVGRPGRLASLTAALLVFPGVAAAQVAPAGSAAADANSQDGVYLHVGAAALIFDARAAVTSRGATISGATVSIDPNVTAITEVGYRRGRLGVSLTGGFPPVATVAGAGTLAPYGTLGRIRYGPVVLTGHYHFGGLGRFQPYVGGGPVLLLVFQDRDVAVTRLRVDNHWGVAAQVGAEYILTRRLALYLDFKKAALKTQATAELCGAPIQANIRLNPAVVSGGISFRF